MFEFSAYATYKFANNCAIMFFSHITKIQNKTYPIDLQAHKT